MRPSNWPKLTIETAEAASAEEALKVGLIDFISSDLDELLSQLDGFPVETGAGERVIHTSGARVEQLNITLIEEILGILTNPNIVFLLITVGVQAILIEISSPGGWVAGFIGVVALALATYGLGILPVNWFGLIFLATAFVLFILDIKAPTHGALTAAGVASLIVGALVLFNSPGTPDFQRVSIPLVVGTSLATAAIFFTVVGFGLRAMRMPIRTGQEALRGRTGLTRTAIGANAAGTVQLGGKPGRHTWPRAKSQSHLTLGYRSCAARACVCTCASSKNPDSGLALKRSGHDCEGAQLPKRAPTLDRKLAGSTTGRRERSESPRRIEADCVLGFGEGGG